MDVPLELDDLKRAWQARDPDLVRLVLALATQDEPSKTPPREGAPTFQKWLATIRTPGFKHRPREEQHHYRVEQMKALESPDAEVPLPPKLRLHEILLALWNDNGPFARRCLLDVITGVPLDYGPWRALKRIFKEAEAKSDTEVYGALAARFDAAFARKYGFGVSSATLAYLCRRAWRFLRRSGQTLPACYADNAVDFLAHYTDDTHWAGTWVANHIFYHEGKAYNRGHFTFYSVPKDILKQRAFGELWQRTPRPLFSLLERAKSDKVRDFAITALKTDFRAVLREVEPTWVARLVTVGSAVIDDFVVWILGNVPRFEQAAFRSLGLHDAVLKLFDSPSDDARAYAANYARTHARDLPVAELVRLCNNDHKDVHKLAIDLLLARDPRKDVGLDAWGKVLETEHGHDTAVKVLLKSFGASELTPAWFRERFLSRSEQAFEFARKNLQQFHPLTKLGPGFLVELFEEAERLSGEDDDEVEEAIERAVGFVLRELPKFDVNTVDQGVLRRLLLHPQSSYQVGAWIDEGRLRVESLGTDYFKSLAYHVAYEKDPWFAELRGSGRPWAKDLRFDESFADRVLNWLADVRKFAPTDLGFAWLMELVGRAEPRYHDFAVELMSKAFVPADFAPAEQPTGEAAPAAAAAKVDLGGASFLFTGKMASMKREDAEAQVKANGGAVFSSVSAKLHYLVIGDEGSPLYGQGKKGSKQTKAEDLNASGGNIRIISETAFLQMLKGKPLTVSADATLAGCERLWQMALAPGNADAPLAAFARKYLRAHHPDIGQQLTGRPVDPGAEIPASFLTFERVQPLFAETRKPLRDFALELAKWEFARWAPPMEAIIKLCELPFPDVRKFVGEALLADDSAQHRCYRVDPAVLTPRAVFSFCESPDEATRQLGMALIQRLPRLQVPEELYRLTESPDRHVRAFAIRKLWALYRDRGISADWKPTLPPQSKVGTPSKKMQARAELLGTGPPPRPAEPPGNPAELTRFLRRILFEIPPGRSAPRPADEEEEGLKVRLRPLPARKAKLALVEVLRDLALEDKEFAAGVLPLLEEFMDSRGQSEMAACLVAATRIRKALA
jgi:hypothetical protein